MNPILDDDQKKNEIVQKLGEVGIIVNSDGTIEYDEQNEGMNLRLPKLVLLRHGQTQGASSHLFMSDNSANSMLTEKGKDRIKSELNGYCEAQNIDKVVVCSDIPRVLETAEVFRSINPDTDFIYKKGYKGINNGGWEGKNKNTLQGDDLASFIEREEKHNIFAKSSKGESWGQVLLNTVDLINYLNANFSDKSVLLVGQESILRAINILIRTYKTPWEGYDTKTLYNFEPKEETDNYGRPSEVCNNIIENDGMIHGRFQPFHNGHLEHLKRALARVPKGHKLYVGITKPFKSDNGLSTGDDHRDSDESNPYTFEQRRAMILKTIEMDPEVSDRLKDIIVIPWSMNNEHDLENIVNTFFPDRKSVTQFMNVIPGDGWEYKKQDILTSMGFKTVNLVDPKKGRITCATDVRGLMKSPNTFKTHVEYKRSIGSWKDLIPSGTLEILDNLDTIPSEYSSIDDFLNSIPAINAHTIARKNITKRS